MFRKPSKTDGHRFLTSETVAGLLEGKRLLTKLCIAFWFDPAKRDYAAVPVARDISILLQIQEI